MKLKINVNKKINETEIIINTNNIDEKIVLIEQIVNDNMSNNIIAYQDNKIFVINVFDVFKFVSDNKFVYCYTSNGTFKIRDTLYALENSLAHKNFIRISKSCIINLKYVAYFDMSIIGIISVVMENKNVEIVSKRRIKSIMDFLKRKNGGI